uniref:Uncharacterized protein n=1 Tax=Romanomermis culicivorax TaxID=13658 RepID=A0A915I7D7_ROMCU
MDENGYIANNWLSNWRQLVAVVCSDRPVLTWNVNGWGVLSTLPFSAGQNSVCSLSVGVTILRLGETSSMAEIDDDTQGNGGKLLSVERLSSAALTDC